MTIQLDGPTSETHDDTDKAPQLTEREIEILHHVSNGLTADAVARRLMISSRTVGKHLENSYRKLRCNNRLVAVQLARELELIPLQQPRLDTRWS